MVANFKISKQYFLGIDLDIAQNLECNIHLKSTTKAFGHYHGNTHTQTFSISRNRFVNCVPKENVSI